MFGRIKKHVTWLSYQMWAPRTQYVRSIAPNPTCKLMTRGSVQLVIWVGDPVTVYINNNKRV